MHIHIMTPRTNPTGASFLSNSHIVLFHSVFFSYLITPFWQYRQLTSQFKLQTAHLPFNRLPHMKRNNVSKPLLPWAYRSNSCTHIKTKYGSYLLILGIFLQLDSVLLLFQSLFLKVDLVCYILGLFHGAILQSGAGIAPWSVMLEKFGAEDYMYQMAEKFGCDNSSMQAIVDCMRQQDAQDIADQDSVECPVRKQ